MKYRGFTDGHASLGRSTDLNADGSVDRVDLDYVLAGLWVQEGGEGDSNGDGAITEADVNLLMSNWGPCRTDCVGDLDGDGGVGNNDLRLLSWAYWVDGGGNADVSGDGIVNSDDVMKVLADQDLHDADASDTDSPTRTKNMSSFFPKLPLTPTDRSEDLNSDGKVDEADLHYVLAGLWAQEGGGADPNGDGAITKADVKLIKANLGPCPDECKGDVNADGKVNNHDLELLKWVYWSNQGGSADLSGDGKIDSHDIVILLAKQDTDNPEEDDEEKLGEGDLKTLVHSATTAADENEPVGQSASPDRDPKIDSVGPLKKLQTAITNVEPKSVIGDVRGSLTKPESVGYLSGDPNGSQPQVADVNLFQGSYSPTVNLSVLPAKNGLSPDLRIVYNPLKVNGWLGAGWSLAFSSSIQRRSKLGGVVVMGLAVQDPSEAFDYFADGQKLMSAPEGDGTYRAENDPFTVYKPVTKGKPSLGNFLKRIVEWQVTRNGLTRTYGSSTRSGLLQDGVSYGALDLFQTPVKWHLTKIKDSLGNTIHFEYESVGYNGDPTHALRPSRIEYNDRRHIVELLYEPRPDVHLDARDGIRRIISERLAEILVKAYRSDTEYIAFQYRFLYSQPAGDVQSMLERVVRDEVDFQTGAVGKEVLLQKFEYGDIAPADHPGWANWEKIEVVGEELTPSYYDFSGNETGESFDTFSQLLDVNRDAQPDLVVFNTKCSRPSDGDPDQKIIERELEPDDAPNITFTTCASHHRVFLNTSLSPGSPPRFVYNSKRSEQINTFIGPLRKDVVPDETKFLIIDLDGDGYPDLVRGPGRSDYPPQTLNGDANGWDYTDETRLNAAEWTEDLGGSDPFSELQLSDVNGDGKLDLLGETRLYLNRGSPPYFLEGDGQDLSILSEDGSAVSLPADLPPDLPPTIRRNNCMALDSDPRDRYMENELGVWYDDGKEYYIGMEDTKRRVDPEKYVWRHTSFSDYNGDGIADRLVALAWPEEAFLGISQPSWADAFGACGGRNMLYLGNGRGEFRAAGYGVGGAYSWPGGPRANHVSYTEVEETVNVVWKYKLPVNHVAMVDLDASGRPELTQLCDTGVHTLPHAGLAKGFQINTGDDVACPNEAVRLPFMWTGDVLSGDEQTFIGSSDNRVFGGFADMDSDGFGDAVVMHNPVHPNDTGLVGSADPHWARNLRTVAQNRLTAIIGPHGGRTEIEWTVSTLFDNTVGTTIPVVASITGPLGRTKFEFTGALSEDGKFLGFQYAKATGTSGVSREWKFRSDVDAQGSFVDTLGSVEYALTRSASGALYELDAFVRGKAWSGLVLDTIAPYFNPVVRSCKFKFESSFTDTGTDVELFLSECEDFSGEPFGVGADYRLQVTEQDWDLDLGVVSVGRNLADVTTEADSLTTQYFYHPHDESLVFTPLDRVIETDTEGNKKSRNYPLGSYYGTYWGIEYQTQFYLTPEAESRGRLREYADGALVYETAWGFGRTAYYTIDHCGAVSRKDTAITGGGRWWDLTRDPVCRVKRRETSTGLLELTEHDDLHRIIKRTVRSSGSPDQVTRFAYDRSSLPGEPAEVRIYPEPDGSETLEKLFVDEYGRRWKSTRCRRAGGLSDDWQESLNQAYACADSDEVEGDYNVQEITLYSAASGSVTLESLPYDKRDGQAQLSNSPTFPEFVPSVEFAGEVPYRLKEHDRYGRVFRATLADGHVATTTYGVGRETVTSHGIEMETIRDTLTKKTYRNGELIETVERNAFGDITGRIDARGHRTDYLYDGYGRLIEIQHPEVEIYETCQTEPTLKRPIETWTYYHTDEVKTQTDANGNEILHSYDQYGRLKEMVGLADGAVLIHVEYFDTAGEDRRKEVTDELGNVTITWLDALDRPATIQAPDGTLTTFTYDVRGRQAEATLPTGEVIETSYDRHGRMRSITRHMGDLSAITKIFYNARNQQVHQIDADGEIREHVYDPVGRLLESTLGDPLQNPRTIVENTYDENGRLKQSLANGVRAYFAYDENGRLIEKLIGYEPGATPESLEQQTFNYNKNDQLREVTNGEDEGVRRYYDAAGRITKEEVLHKGNVLASREKGYDTAGNIVRTVVESGLVDCMGYDAYHRPNAITPAGLGTTVIEYTRGVESPLPMTPSLTPFPYVHSFTTDPEAASPKKIPLLNLRTKTTSPTGEFSETYTDGMGRNWLLRGEDGSYLESVYSQGLLTERRRRDPDMLIHSAKATIYYNNSDRKEADWDWMPPDEVEACLADPSNCAYGRVTYTYTDAGRVSSIADAQGNLSEVHFSNNGQMLPRKVKVGEVTEIRREYHPRFLIESAREVGPKGAPIRSERTYDRNLHLTQMLRTRKASGEVEINDLTYDRVGRRTSAILTRDGVVESEVSWEYDRKGRLYTKTYKILGQTISAPGKDWSLRWRYEPNNQLSAVTYPSGNNVTYLYNTHGLLDQIVLGTSESDPLIAGFRDYDAVGSPLSTKLSGDTFIQRTFEGGHESTRTVSGSTGRFFKEAYAYDGIGRQTNAVRILADGANEEINYTYDPRDMLTKESITKGDIEESIEYVYDSAGLRTTKTSTKNNLVLNQDTYTYWPGYRLKGVNNTTIGPLDWDAYGQQLRDHHGNTLRWGLSGQLREIKPSSGDAELMFHDVDGQRVAREAAGDLDVFLSSDLSGEVLHHRRANGTSQDVVRAPGGGVFSVYF